MKRVFASDIHVGSLESKYVKFLKMINEENPDEIYLIGDVFDLWITKFEKILEKNFDFLKFITYCKVPIFYVYGNHDEHVDKHFSYFGSVKFSESIDLESNGKKIRIIHGHTYDKFVENYCFLAKFVAVLRNITFKLGLDIKRLNFSFAKQQHTKEFPKILKAVKDRAIADSIEYDILIMGHLHVPEHEMINKFEYLNLGDWVTHTTYGVEENGKFALKTYQG